MESGPDVLHVGDEHHAMNVERTVAELQRMVHDHERALSQVCFKTASRKARIAAKWLFSSSERMVSLIRI
jgi:hypothetical protein